MVQLQQIQELQKGDGVLIEFPPGVEPTECSFLRMNKDETKIQVQELKGQLMWYGVQYVFAVDKKTVEKTPQPKAEKQPDKLDIDKESKKAQEQLDKIEALKKSDNRADKKLTKKEQIISLIRKGLSNKEICEIVGCDPAYPSGTRERLYKSGALSIELRSSRKKSLKHNYAEGEEVLVLVNNKETQGLVTEPADVFLRSRFFVRLLGHEEVVAFSRSTGKLISITEDDISLVTKETNNNGK